jgi:choline dehydrogenase-like flavoprotein
MNQRQAYYEPNKEKPNLVVLTGAHVTRILFNTQADKSGKLVASDAEYLKDGQLHTISAKGEVLLCAGKYPCDLIFAVLFNFLSRRIPDSSVA